MSKKWRILISVVLMCFVAWRTEWQQVLSVFRQLRIELWLAAVALYLVTQVVSALRWQLLSEPLGFKRDWVRFARFYYVGMFFNLLLPTSVGGDVVRALYLDGGSGKKMPAFVSVFVDRFSGLLVLLALACLAVPFAPAELPNWIPLSVWGVAAAAVAGFLVLPWLARRVEKLDRPRRMIQTFWGYRERPALLVSSTVLSIFVQAANVILVWLVGHAINAPIPAGYYWIMVPMVTLLTLAPISLNGMGVREGGTILFLRPLGVPSSVAITLAFLWFLVFTVASLCGGAVYLFGSFPRLEERLHGSVCRDSDQGRARQSQAAA